MVAAGVSDATLSCEARKGVVISAKFTTPRAKNKPLKPYADYPFYAHSSGRWAKKIRQKLHYLGPCDDPDGALERSTWRGLI